MAEKFLLKAILSAVDKLTPTLVGIQKVAASTKKHLGAISGAATDLAGKVGVPLGLFTAALGGASLLGVKNAVMNFTEMGAALDDTTKRMKLTGGELQRLNYLALQSDVSAEGLQNSMAKLNLNIGEAASGKNKEFAALLRKLKIDPKSIKNGVDLLPKLADAFQRNTSPMARARMGMAAFGKTYQEMLPILVDGSAGILQNFDRWKQIGFPMTDGDLATAAAFDDQLNDLKLSTQGLSTILGRQLVPLLSPVVEKIIQWMTANRAWLANSITKAVEDLVKAAGKVDWQHVITSTYAAIKAFASFIEFIGGIKVALIALMLILNAGAIVALVQLIGTVGTAVIAFSTWAGFTGVLSGALGFLGSVLRVLSWLFLTNPIGLAITGIVVAAALIITHWDKVKSWFSTFFDWIGEKWAQLTGWIGEVVTAAGRFLGLTGGASGNQPSGGVAAGGARASLVAPAQRMSGAITVDFQNAPQGMRVMDSSVSPGSSVSSNVGYRGLALG